MKDQKQKGFEELNPEDLEQVTGGGLRDVVIEETEDISDDTKDKI